MASRMTMPRKKIGAKESATLTGMVGAEVGVRKAPPTARAAALRERVGGKRKGRKSRAVELG
jgi:hypothetical protein